MQSEVSQFWVNDAPPFLKKKKEEGIYLPCVSVSYL